MTLYIMERIITRFLNFSTPRLGLTINLSTHTNPYSVEGLGVKRVYLFSYQPIISPVLKGIRKIFRY